MCSQPQYITQNNSESYPDSQYPIFNRSFDHASGKTEQAESQWIIYDDLNGVENIGI